MPIPRPTRHIDVMLTEEQARSVQSHLLAYWPFPFCDYNTKRALKAATRKYGDSIRKFEERQQGIL